MAYLSKVKSNGKIYIYLTEYCGKNAFTNKSEKHIYSFGEINKALLSMMRWKMNFEEFPCKLLQQGHKKKDLEKWIMQLEAWIKSNGKNIKYEHETVQYLNISIY